MDPRSPAAYTQLQKFVFFCKPALFHLWLGSFLQLHAVTSAARVDALESRAGPGDAEPWRRAEHPMAPHSPVGDQLRLAGDFIQAQWPPATEGLADGPRWHWDHSGMAKVTGKSCHRLPWKHSTFGSGAQSGFLIPFLSALRLRLCPPGRTQVCPSVPSAQAVGGPGAGCLAGGCRQHGPRQP